MTLQVLPFHRAGTGSWRCPMPDACTRAVALVDPVLDDDAASARLSTALAQALVDAGSGRSGRVDSCHRRFRIDTPLRDDEALP